MEERVEVYLDDLFPDFYEKVGVDFRKNLQSGQLCLTPVPYTHEHRQLWRPDGYDDTQTTATLFSVVAQGNDAYNRRVALVTPRLAINEEFPVVRAKKRPMVLMRPIGPDIPVKQLPGGSPVNLPLALVLPVYSAVDPEGKATMPLELVRRVRQLEFPELFFLPGEGVIHQDSIIRVSRLTNVFQPHLEPLQWKLSNPILRILQGQLVFAVTGEYAGDYADAREQLLHP